MALKKYSTRNKLMSLTDKRKRERESEKERKKEREREREGESEGEKNRFECQKNCINAFLLGYLVLKMVAFNK